jgi:hypothetical protein
MKQVTACLQCFVQRKIVKENQENCDSLFFQVVFRRVVLQACSALQHFASHSATITQIIEKMKTPEIQTMGWKRNTG